MIFSIGGPITLPCQFLCNEGADDGYITIVSRILPITARLLEDEKPEVTAILHCTMSHEVVGAIDHNVHLMSSILRCGKQHAQH